MSARKFDYVSSAIATIITVLRRLLYITDGGAYPRGDPSKLPCVPGTATLRDKVSANYTQTFPFLHNWQSNARKPMIRYQDFRGSCRSLLRMVKSAERQKK